MKQNNYMERIKQKIEFLKSHRGKLVCDADSHISNLGTLSSDMVKRMASTDNYFHGKPISSEQLLDEMELAGIDVSLIWQNPAVTAYGDSKRDNYASLLAANTYIADSSVNYPTKFIPAGWTDPKALGLELASDMVKQCIEQFRFPIVKLNPAQNEYPIDSDEVIKIVEIIVSYGAIPAFHYGADTEYTSAEGLEHIASHFNNTPLIAVHMGGGGAAYLEAESLYNTSRELGLKHNNIYYVMSAKRDCHMESDFITYQMAGKPFNKHLFCGSDAPYGRQSFNFGGFRTMFHTLKNSALHSDMRIKENPGLFNDEAIEGYLGTNFLDTIIPVYNRIC